MDKSQHRHVSWHDSENSILSENVVQHKYITHLQLSPRRMSRVQCELNVCILCMACVSVCMNECMCCGCACLFYTRFVSFVTSHQISNGYHQNTIGSHLNSVFQITYNITKCQFMRSYSENVPVVRPCQSLTKYLLDIAYVQASMCSCLTVCVWSICTKLIELFVVIGMWMNDIVSILCFLSIIANASISHIADVWCNVQSNECDRITITKKTSSNGGSTTERGKHLKWHERREHLLRREAEMMFD